MPMHTRVSASWKEVTELHTRVGGTWKVVQKGYVRVSEVWKQFYTAVALAVSANVNGDTNTNFGTCYVGVQLTSGGVEYERNASSGLYNVSQGGYMVAGDPSEVWVEFVRTGGTEAAWPGFSNSTRYNLGTTRGFGFDSSGSSASIIGYFRFWDASSGGNILQLGSTVTWEAIDTSV